MRTAWMLLKVAVAVVVLSTALGAGAFAASSFYQQFGSPRVENSILSWADRPETYLATDCRSCHQAEAVASASDAHQAMICETCHRPAVDHPGPVPGVVAALPAATSADCVACHATVAGRPTGWPEVALERHYAGADCVTCHDPHSTIPAVPPEVTHPLANLPACIVCHAPDGLKSFPQGHKAAPDEVCLSCHRPGAGGQ
jgi:nitrate/TMAO reductase-like tetraheme cytochrome c subunit